MMGAATEKARLLRFSLVLGIESCCDSVMQPQCTVPGVLNCMSGRVSRFPSLY